VHLYNARPDKNPLCDSPEDKGCCNVVFVNHFGDYFGDYAPCG
jgi:hypothetical protein